MLLNKGYKITPQFYQNDPWKIAGRNHSIQMIQLLIEITCNIPDNLSPTFINTNFYNALPYAIYKPIGFENVEKMCIKFESISNKISEANAIKILKKILLFTKIDYNYNEKSI